MNQEETMLLHKERYKETIKNLTVMSDILARNVFKDKNACEYVLRIILEDKELTVIDNETQMDFRNMHGRGVVLDCVAKDGSGLPIAHIDRIIRENGKEFGDEEHFIYVDSSKDDGGELGRLMHDFRAKEAKEMQAGALADRVHELKETEKGVEHMCKEMEQLCDERELETKKNVAYSLAEKKMSVEDIAEVIKVNIETVKSWLASTTAAR